MNSGPSVQSSLSEIAFHEEAFRQRHAAHLGSLLLTKLAIPLNERIITVSFPVTLTSKRPRLFTLHYLPTQLRFLNTTPEAKCTPRSTHDRPDQPRANPIPLEWPSGHPLMMSIHITRSKSGTVHGWFRYST